MQVSETKKKEEFRFMSPLRDGRHLLAGSLPSMQTEAITVRCRGETTAFGKKLLLCRAVMLTAWNGVRRLFGAVNPDARNIRYFGCVVLPNDVKALLIFIGERGISIFRHHQDQA